ncbi:putative peroxisomal membrane protein PEX13-like [Apostichopus japonicus]|uniref:Putative peroxisomal membrane protein PEX13-like n=1 Tax=Stichopus japonicus TaxID=307972 RepID=A0A2G8LI17_STIJA|nr:putative peroxisomal membrane protein PEX13-like [Apostichopus japonicus]
MPNINPTMRLLEFKTMTSSTTTVSKQEKVGVPEWASGEEDHVVARAEYDFDSDRQDEVSFKAGNVLNLAPKELQPNIRGWLLAMSMERRWAGTRKLHQSTGGKEGNTPCNRWREADRLFHGSIPPKDTGATAQPAGLPGDVTNGANLSSSWNEWSAPKTDQESQLSAFNEIYKEEGNTEKKECCSGQSKVT